MWRIYWANNCLKKLGTLLAYTKAKVTADQLMYCLRNGARASHRKRTKAFLDYRLALCAQAAVAKSAFFVGYSFSESSSCKLTLSL
jgi:hypothetical protein